MNGDKIRQSFLDFFEARGHLVMPSASLVPAGDPTLLFTSAGMVPFKQFFTGESISPSQRLTSSQKSFRVSDIDEVGNHKHLTFFEMLGNFSIGDYFKKKAILWAWEYVTEVFKLSPERLYATIYLDDDDAFQIWHHEIGLPKERIFRYGKEDNWWGPAGNEGSCGPCSELHYDFSGKRACDLLLMSGGVPDGHTEACHPNHECKRFMELWNLVFMQFFQDSVGNQTPLPAPSIDTGMSLERAAAIMQNKETVYETDLLWPILDRVCQISGKTYGQDEETDVAIRVVSEHGRSASFVISDGVVPGNEGRGYVLRRLIRRAVRFGRKLGLERPFLAEVSQATIDRFGAVYPEMKDNRNFILQVLTLEEDRFREAIEIALPLVQDVVVPIHNRFADMLDSPSMVVPGSTDKSSPELNMTKVLKQFKILKKNFIKTVGQSIFITEIFNKLEKGITNGSNDELRRLTKLLSGREAFILYDTYGFPVELTREIAGEHGLDVDMDSFQIELEAQRERSRSANDFTGGMGLIGEYESLKVDQVSFVGYESLSQETMLIAILVDNMPVNNAKEAQKVDIVLQKTPFYAQAGGQVGDKGYIIGLNGKVKVEDTVSPVAGLIIHRGLVETGAISVGDLVKARVDHLLRAGAAKHHTGTHLLHAALRNILGSHVKQAGSLVASNRLRFDFSHVAGMSREEILETQRLVNIKVMENLKVENRETTYAKAVRDGALAFFGDKYGDQVRVVDIGNDFRFSFEVCGGTHVTHTGEVGALFILGESSIGGGMRRVEAVTGHAAEQLFTERTGVLEEISRKLQTPMNDLEARLDAFMEETEQLRSRIADMERGLLQQEAKELLHNVRRIGDVNVLSSRISASSVDAMRETGDWVKSKLSSGVVVLGGIIDARPMMVAMVTPDLVKKGFHAGNIMKEVASLIGGGGGGRSDIAQAGGKNSGKLDDTLKEVFHIVRREVKR